MAICHGIRKTLPYNGTALLSGIQQPINSGGCAELKDNKMPLTFKKVTIPSTPEEGSNKRDWFCCCYFLMIPFSFSISRNAAQLPACAFRLLSISFILA